MIPATNSVTAFDSATGEKLVYDQWVPVSVNINAPDDLSNAKYTPTSASVTLTRCRTVDGKTDRLPEYTARRLGVERSVHLHVQNLYAAPTDTGESFKPKPYPEGASKLIQAQIDVENEQSLERYTRERNAYPQAVAGAILAAPATPKSLMELVVSAAAVLGYAQGKL